MNTSALPEAAARSIYDRIGDFSDRFNPMLVKELRQGIRTSVFVSLFIVLQVVGALILLAGELSETFAQNAAAGLFWALILLILLVLQPLRAITTLSGEKKSKTMDFLEVSNLSALNIVWGKWSSLFAQSGLIIMSLLPYFILRYFQSGADLFHELLILGSIFLASGLITAIVILMSSEESKIKLAVTYGALLMFIGPGMLGLGTFLVYEAIGRHRSSSFADLFINTLEWWKILGYAFMIVFLWAYLIWVILCWAAKTIAPLSQNIETPLRLIHLAVWLIIAASAWFFEPTSVFVLLVIITVPVIFSSLSERPSILPPILKPFVLKGAAGRLAGRFLYPGWTSGLLYTLLVFGLFALWIFLHYRAEKHFLEKMVILGLVWGLFAIVAVVLYGFREWKNEKKVSAYTRTFIIFHFLSAMGSALFMNNNIFSRSGENDDSSHWLALVSPASTLSYFAKIHDKKGIDSVVIIGLTMVLFYTIYLGYCFYRYHRSLRQAEQATLISLSQTSSRSL
jgi:hypothetical protein